LIFLITADLSRRIITDKKKDSLKRVIGENLAVENCRVLSIGNMVVIYYAQSDLTLYILISSNLKGINFFEKYYLKKKLNEIK
jgi:hypothetical protein